MTNKQQQQHQIEGINHVDKNTESLLANEPTHHQKPCKFLYSYSELSKAFDCRNNNELLRSESVFSATEDEEKSSEPTSTLCSEVALDLGQKLENVLFSSNGIVDLEQLKSLCWKGISKAHFGALRSLSWKYLLGYIPCVRSRQSLTLYNKRLEYFTLAGSFGIYPNKTPGFDLILYNQIKIDVPRTSPSTPLFSLRAIHKMMERILYCWSIRNPASGYVQGLNDVLTPFLVAFLSEYLKSENGAEPCNPTLRNTEPCKASEAVSNADLISQILSKDVEELNDTQEPTNVQAPILRIGHYALTQSQLQDLEADCFWCFTRLLENLHDFYTVGQPGITKQMARLKDLLSHVDPELVTHLAGQGVEFHQFLFRWTNCLLIRELPLHLIVRLWDTCLAEGDIGFSGFYVYIQAVLLLSWSTHLQSLEFQELLVFLQNIPTAEWTLDRIDLICSEAYLLKKLYP